MILQKYTQFTGEVVFRVAMLMPLPMASVSKLCVGTVGDSVAFIGASSRAVSMLRPLLEGKHRWWRSLPAARIIGSFKAIVVHELARLAIREHLLGCDISREIVAGKLVDS